MGTATYQELWNELLFHRPELDPLIAPKFIQRAWRRIRDYRHWGFLMAQGIYYSPGIITAGAISVQQFNNQVTLNAAASAAVTGLSTPLITKRQLRVAGGPLYRIVEANFDTPAAVLLTLDRQYMETTNTAAQYGIFRTLFNQPQNGTSVEVTDYLRLRSVVDPVSGYSLKLHFNAEELNWSDPVRANEGQPYIIATRQSLSDGTPVYEFWPWVTFDRTFLVVYQRRGIDMVDNEVLPLVISDELILECAQELTAKWARSQLDSKFRGIRWGEVIADHHATYMDLLPECARQDEEQMIQNLSSTNQLSNLGFPIDSAFYQDHGI